MTPDNLVLNNFIDPVSSICELPGGSNNGYSFCGSRTVVVYNPSTGSELPASMFKYDANNKRMKIETITDASYSGTNSWELRVRLQKFKFF